MQQGPGEGRQIHTDRFRFLYFGDIVGTPGVKTLERLLPLIRSALAVDAAFANGENAAPGNGLTPAVAARLYKAGLDALTLGNHTWQRKELLDYLPQDSRLARPANGAKSWPGRGYACFKNSKATVYLINLQGQVFLQMPQSPFSVVDDLLEQLTPEPGSLAVVPEPKSTTTEDNKGGSGRVQISDLVGETGASTHPSAARPQIIIVDMHAEATAEKMAMGWHLDGRVAAVLGTHTHVQTADARILPGGTAYMTDLGMCGPTEGVLGMDREVARRRLVDGLPTRYEVAKGPTALEAVLVDYDLAADKTATIASLRVPGHTSRAGLPDLLADQTGIEADLMRSRLGLSDRREETMTSRWTGSGEGSLLQPELD